MTLTDSKSRSRLSPVAGYLVFALATLVQRLVLGPRPAVIDHDEYILHHAPPVRKRRSESALPLSSPRAWWSLLRDTANSWMAHKAARLGAALAYYSIFSLGPLMLIAISVAGLLFGRDAVHGQVSAQLASLLGEQGARGIESMLAGAGRSGEGALATALGLATLVFAAVGVVVQLKDALNTVWEVEPKAKSGLWGFVRTYAISIAAVLAVAFLLLVSLLVTTALSAVGNTLEQYMPEAVFHVVIFIVSFAVISVLFAMMFKWLPDAFISWRDVIPGAILTAALFEAGRFLIGLYIGKQGLESTYGAAASIVVVLIWVYYSAQLVLFGAEFTAVYARKYGSGTRSET
jgi:membrane protein